jgi:hypothetical protein
MFNHTAHEKTLFNVCEFQVNCSVMLHRVPTKGDPTPLGWGGIWHRESGSMPRIPMLVNKAKNTDFTGVFRNFPTWLAYNFV